MSENCRLPSHLVNAHRDRAELHALKARLRKAGLHTVCESARCPNIVECFNRPTAAFMILGNRCSRGCRFCAVAPGTPGPPDPNEPIELARAAAELKLRHVVVTSVTRDDLADGGAAHFAAVIRALSEKLPETKVEVLTPDFQGDEDAVRTVIEAGPHVFNHNLETVKRLYPTVRPRADYERSLEVLRIAAKAGDGRVTIKSGLMVGLGEEAAEVGEALADLARAACRLVTIGQYLQPRRDRLPVARRLDPGEYAAFEQMGRELGLEVFAGPLVRSSYLADRVFEDLGSPLDNQ